MLNTRKLVYILPEVCYVAELLPTKKPHSFSIQSFRQINAPFMEEEDLIVENVQKLFKKLEPETYTIILPDFLFTNTIIDVNETSESGVRDFLLQKLLPGLGLSKASHQLETFILTQHKGKTKVQLSGLEKSVLGPIFPIAEERGITVEAICPLSWTLKSLISLEPSLSAIELGKHLYIAQHYIGVEQSTFFPTSELTNVVETVRTLRGAEPNLQTLYLLTSTETADEVKAQLKQRIPVQQLAEDEVSLDGLPAHLKTAIEAAAKTLDISDFPVPRFKLEKFVQEEDKVMAPPIEEEPTIPAPATEPALTQPSISIFEESLGDDEGEEELPVPAPSLPIAATPLTITATTVKLQEVHPEDEAVSDIADTENDEDIFEIKSTRFEMTESSLEPATQSDREALDSNDNDLEEEEEESNLKQPPTQFVDFGTESSRRGPFDAQDDSQDAEDEVLGMGTQSSKKGEWLDDAVEDVVGGEQPQEKAMPMATSVGQTRIARPVIKNKSSTGSMMKMIGISIAALVITVLVGVGAGFALLKNSEKNSAISQGVTPSPKASPLAAKPTPTPKATASATTASASAKPISLAKDKVKVLIVNATGVAGKAGKYKTAMTATGYKSIETGNAKGTYQKGNFLLMATQDQAFLTQLQKDTALTISFGSEKKTTEDSAGKYDVVLVINE